MIIRYAFENFHSFASRTEISFEVGDKARQSDWVVETELGFKLSKVLVVMGANGSGKTTVLKALAFLSWFIGESWAGAPPNFPLPVWPHMIRPTEPSRFEIEFEADARLWRYTLACTQTQVLTERLEVKGIRFQEVYNREWSPVENKYLYTFPKRDIRMSPKQSKEVRPNCSVISAAAQWGMPLAVRLQEAFKSIGANVGDMGHMASGQLNFGDAAKSFSENASRNELMQKLLGSWDLGLDSIELVETKTVTHAITLNLLNTADGTIQPPPPPLPTPTTVWLPVGVHKSGETIFKLPFFMESNGTRTAFIMLSKILPTLEIGSAAIIDEIEDELHPHMLEALLNLYSNDTINPMGAQLICSTHSPEVLKYMEKHQVFLAEKDDCASNCYRLDSIKGIRPDENLYAKYLAGGYGAIPNI